MTVLLALGAAMNVIVPAERTTLASDSARSRRGPAALGDTWCSPPFARGMQVGVGVAVIGRVVAVRDPPAGPACRQRCGFSAACSHSSHQRAATGALAGGEGAAPGGVPHDPGAAFLALTPAGACGDSRRRRRLGECVRLGCVAVHVLGTVLQALDTSAPTKWSSCPWYRCGEPWWRGCVGAKSGYARRYGLLPGRHWPQRRSSVTRARGSAGGSQTVTAAGSVARPCHRDVDSRRAEGQRTEHPSRAAS